MKIYKVKEIVHICKIHGELTLENTKLNRLSPKGRIYFRCKECRNEGARKRLKIKYLSIPKKHEKNKLPSFISDENKSHAYTVLHRFKMKPEEYYDLLKKQDNKCAICKNIETMKKRNSDNYKMLAVDHCHESHRKGIIKIRGLLCQRCNQALGSFKDSIEILQSAIKYLEASI
jgi:hypothetical protein